MGLYIWPVVISLVVLVLAYVLFFVLPEIIDSGMSFIWVIGCFLLLYIGAALYLSHSMPAFGKTNATNVVSDGLVETTVTDVISK